VTIIKQEGKIQGLKPKELLVQVIEVYTGGGDIHVQRKGKSLVICDTQLVQNLLLSPAHDTEDISSLI